MSWPFLAGVGAGFLLTALACGGLGNDGAPTLDRTAQADDAAVTPDPVLGRCAGGGDDLRQGAPELPFRLRVEDVFQVEGRGTILAGRITAGCVATGDVLDLHTAAGGVRAAKVAGVEMFRKVLDRGCAGDNVGLILGAVDGVVTRGDVAAARGTAQAHRALRGHIRLARPGQDPVDAEPRTVAVGPTEVDATLTVAEGDATGALPLQAALARAVVVDVGDCFQVREGGRPLAHGVVTEVGAAGEPAP